MTPQHKVNPVNPVNPVKLDDVYGKLTVIEVPDPEYRSAYVKVRCTCGAELFATRSELTASHKKDCGKHRGRPPKDARKTDDPRYMLWRCLKHRYRKSASPIYAARKLHRPWIDSFEAFCADTGPRPPYTRLTLINKNGDMAPGNVRWAPLKKLTGKGKL